MANDMAKKITPLDAEKLIRSLLMEWYKVSSKCVDWKLKTSRVTKHKQDIFGVFDVLLNDRNNTTIGYQIKYWSREITNAEMLKWSQKVLQTNFDPKNAFMLVLVHTTSKIHISSAVDCLQNNHGVGGIKK